MASVTARASQVKQPRGGYINPSQLEIVEFEDGYRLGEENIHPSIVGMTVDYLTRILTGGSVQAAFFSSVLGYLFRTRKLGSGTASEDKRKKIDIDTLLSTIKGLDDESIIAACKATTYDVWYRNPRDAMHVRGAEETNPDESTILNIRIMVNRGLEFFDKFGPVTARGFTFGAGYSDVVTSGDGDYLTEDALWDFKVSKNAPKSIDTLQILMYYLMGEMSGKDIFFEDKKTKIGIFNPRLNKAYSIDIDAIPDEVMEEVMDKVICY